MTQITINNRWIRLILQIVVAVIILVSIPFIYNLALNFYQQNLKINKSSIDEKNDSIDMDKSMTEAEILVNKLNQPFNIENPIILTGSTDRKTSVDIKNVDAANKSINSPVNVKINPQTINNSINKPFGN
jgi:hypothetical protein